MHDHLVDQLKFRIFTLWDHRDTYRKTGKAGKGAECNINTGRVDSTLPYKKNKTKLLGPGLIMDDY